MFPQAVRTVLLLQGLTTYEYVVAMRAVSEQLAGSVDEEGNNIIYSPTNSATTGISVSSSLGLPYRGVWCTPPRVFVDQQVAFGFYLTELSSDHLVWAYHIRWSIEDMPLQMPKFYNPYKNNIMDVHDNKLAVVKSHIWPQKKKNIPSSPFVSIFS